MAHPEPPDLPADGISGIRSAIRTESLSYDMVKPFGPSLLETTLPDRVLESLLTLTDSLVSDPARESWGDHLVGQIREELRLRESALAEAGVLDYLKGMFAEYVMGAIAANAPPAYQAELVELRRTGQFRNPVQVRIESAWVVSQRAGEFNPIHGHTEAQLSSVIYLKVPQVMQGEPIPGKPPINGHIEFVNGCVTPGGLQNSSVRVAPVAGRFYIFPAELLHMVYPFESEEERRSISINVRYKA